MRKRNTIRLREISGRAYTNAELMSDRLGPYIQVLRANGVNTYTRFCSDVQWSGIVGDRARWMRLFLQMDLFLYVPVYTTGMVRKIIL